MSDTISTTYGALLLGSSFAYGLTGVLGFQCLRYYMLYPDDRYVTKVLVLVVWFLDLLHTVFVCAAIVYYFITHFGDHNTIAHIPWSIAFSVVVTAIQTFIAHCFFSLRILKSSGRNWYIVTPIAFLALCRLLAASVSTAEMIRVREYVAFTQKYPGWIFTLGLSLSSGTDIIITAWLCYFLRNLRGLTGSTVMVQAIDLLIRYTLETGLLTCVATTASLICWLAMPDNLVFLGLHFTIGKLYANSVLASLNTRQELRGFRSKNSRSWMYPSAPAVSMSLSEVPRSPISERHPDSPDTYKSSMVKQMQVSVEQTVELTVSPQFALKR